MSLMRTAARTTLAVSTVAGLVVAGTTTATADPDPAAFRTYSAVGSDTTQDVWNGLTNGTKAKIKVIGSYNAFGSATIKTKSAGATFARPAGSTAGVRALSAVHDPAYTSHDFDGVALTNNEVDFARSSSGPSTGVGLTYMPFARDAVSVVIKPFSGATTTRDFTTAQLQAIYGGPDDNTAGTKITYQAGTGLPKIGSRVFRPKLPQGSSGTRSFFLSAIGITAGDIATYIEPPASTLPENDGTVLTQEGDMIPFSAAQFIAQTNGSATSTIGGLIIAKLNGLEPVVKGLPGPLFGPTNPQGAYSIAPVPGVGVFNRDTYNVVPTSFLTNPAKADLMDRLTGTGSGRLGSAGAQAVVKKYGFGNLAYFGDPSEYKSGAWRH